MKSIKLLFFILLSIQVYAQKEVKINGMLFQYEIKEDSLYGFLSAPTMGWLMIGFNDKNTTSGADFKFFAVIDQTNVASDRKNIEGRNYPSDMKLGGKNNIKLIEGEENQNGTEISFVLPLQTGDTNDFQHEMGKPFWLILAYSAEDDFNHHSRMRKHLPFKWEP